MYLITFEGRWGTTDVFATIPLYLVLFAAVLVELVGWLVELGLTALPREKEKKRELIEKRKNV